MTSKDIIRLIQEHKHDGTYLNGHSNIVAWLIYQEHTDNDYYIEVIDTHEHVRVWSSKKAYDASLLQKSERRPLSYAQEPQQEFNPMLDELRRAIQEEDFMKVIELKARARVLGINVGGEEFNVRKLLKEKGRIR